MQGLLDCDARIIEGDIETSVGSHHAVDKGSNVVLNQNVGDGPQLAKAHSPAFFDCRSGQPSGSDARSPTVATTGSPLGRPKGPRECEFASGKLINLLRFACS
jgi:hypothetical protein